MNAPIRFRLNGASVAVTAPPSRRLSDVLRLDLGLTGTKVGCEAGDCGACTVLVDGVQACACMIPAAQAEGATIVTVEGLAEDGRHSALQRAFARHGAAQCGICTPGMLMAASDLLQRKSRPTEDEAMDALGGVLCRCTGYRKIVEAVRDVAANRPDAPPPAMGEAVGARIQRVDGMPKLDGTERYGDDVAPGDALWLRAVRSPHARATFTLGDTGALHAKYPGLARVFTAKDVPGNNGFGIYPTIKDQPVLADRQVRYRGEAVCALVGDRATIALIRDDEVPIAWQPLAPVTGCAAARAKDAPAVHAHLPDNVLITGRVVRGNVEAALGRAAVTAEGAWETSFVEHAYIEPEAGYARRVGDKLEIHACTQQPFAHRDELAQVMGLPPERVRFIASAVGGGFGGKLDLSLHPLIAMAAWHLNRPVRCVYTRPESMASTTKRHPAEVRGRWGADKDGNLAAIDFDGDFNTGAYASWGPTVATRVPVHASGPYKVGAARALARAVHTNEPPSGAFRGFGVPQAAVLHEGLMDELADKLGMDRLEFRWKNALRVGDATATGQVMEHSAGLAACLEALRPHWKRLRAEAAEHNQRAGNGHAIVRRGVGIGCMWYGIGNTALSNPSTIRLGIAADGRVTLYNGAVDIGQGSTTILQQIAADALGIPVDRIAQVVADTDRTEDAGKTSASRQTFVSGKAAELAGLDLRDKVLRLANAGPKARIAIDRHTLRVRDGEAERTVDLSSLKPETPGGDVLTGRGRFDPPTKPLDADGQGVPYATYGFAAQLCDLEVDVELGTVRLRRFVAAHDVGRAINPTLVEGQIHGGIAQGIGLALMEEYIPGRTENLHDYLIPTVGDVPPIDVILIEDREPLGPYGAKGIGEPALVPTAPAILGAIRDATGAVLRKLPALPHRVRAAIKAAEGGTKP
ncbi:MAG: molybdopterin-dependent oxidoreductase [Alphaproteobacteria bacterium]|nr:molybdopterin-dependent oxidoreductase [Alphaproteobacteria bacterium]